MSEMKSEVLTESPAVIEVKTESQGKVYDEHYVKSLVDENIKWRKRATENRDVTEKVQEATKKMIEELELRSKEQINTLRSLSDERLKKAEIKSIALEMGLKKTDYLKLADFSNVSVSEDGEVIGAKESLENFKQSEPDFFKTITTTNTSLTNQKPSDSFTEEQKAQRQKVLGMTPEEYRKSEAEFLASLR